jgi:PAS domain S-box-containing protein
VLDHATDVICSLDKRLRFQNVNQASSVMWAYEPGELLGKSILSLIPSDFVASTRESLQRLVEIDEGQFENVMDCGNGERRNLAWTVRWSNEQQIYSCVVHDVTERRRMAKLKSEFVAMVSHDLRTPLSSVGVSLALVLSGKKGEVSEKVGLMLAVAQRSLDRLRDLVDDLLELEKLESGKMVMNFEAIRAFDVCVAAIEQLESMASAAGVTVIPPNSDLIALGEERRLIQAVTNLISNAIKYSPRGGNITVKVASADEMVQISVSDQGPGIPPEDRALIFERFGQSRAVSNVQIKSTGIGLAVVKAIVEAHNGQIGVDSEVGMGATFWIRIPKYADDLPGDE